jgi:type I restriction enzyme S subunit
VDFDPVRAKISGEPYPLPDAVMALFPDELVESELGMIPRGWEVIKIKELVEALKEGIDPFDFPNNTFWYYSIPAYDESKFPVREVGENIKSRKYIVSKGTILISKLNPSTPRIWMPIFYGQNSICSTEFLVLHPKDKVYKNFLYFLFSSKQFSNIISTLVTGTSSSHQRVKQRDVLNFKFAHPTYEVIKKYSSFTESLLVKIFTNQKNNTISFNLLSGLLDYFF